MKGHCHKGRSFRTWSRRNDFFESNYMGWADGDYKVKNLTSNPAYFWNTYSRHDSRAVHRGLGIVCRMNIKVGV